MNQHQQITWPSAVLVHWQWKLNNSFNTAIFLEYIVLQCVDKINGDANFPFQLDLAPSYSAISTSNWCTDHGITVLNHPANWPDLNPTMNLGCIVKRKVWDIRPNNTNYFLAVIKANLSFHNTSTVPQTDHLHATPHWCNNLFKGSPDQALTGYINILFRWSTFLVLKNIFLVIL